ncbi:MAG TPA: TadE family protein [Noviherbaspirillum sp.]|uniref:TadE family protein n=1 Tax=Noviherbaspirillum sp. TaxID=1926288 RepID=UPI002F931B32
MEFLFCLPVLILLAFPVADVARIIQANIVAVSIAREGAQLASRTVQDEQSLLEALAAAASPLDMRGNGMIRITKVLGRSTGGGATRSVVIGQHRWVNGGYSPQRGVWECGTGGSYWGAGGACEGLPPPAAAPAVDVMSGELNDGDVVHVVEVFYRLPLLFAGQEFLRIPGMPRLDPRLYAMALL